LARILGEWGDTPTKDQIAERMRTRDQRLAALRAHNAAATRS
jgi:hypothetical protein